MSSIASPQQQPGLVARIRAKQATFASGSLITLVLNGLALPVYALGSIFLARAMGPQQTGDLVWFITGTTTCAIFGDVLGVYYSNSYLVASGSTEFEPPTVRSTVLAYATALGCLVGLVCAFSPLFGVLRFRGFEGLLGRMLVFLNILGMTLVTQIRGIFWGTGSFILMGAITLAKATLYAGLAVAMVYALGYTRAGEVAVAQVAATLLCVVAALLFFLVRGLALPRFAYLWSCRKVGWRGTAVYFGSFLHLRIDQYLVTSILGSTALGLYGVVSSLGETLVQAPTAIGSVLFSEIAAEKDPQRAARITLKRTLFVMLAVTVACVPLALFAQPIVRLVFGEKFLESARLLLFFLPGTVFLSGLVMINGYLAARGYPPIQVAATLGAVAVNVVANVVLLPRIGVAGAPIANSTSCFVWLVLIGGYLIYQTRQRPVARAAIVESGS